MFPVQGIIWEARIGESLLSHSCDLHSPCGAGSCQGQGQSPPTLAEGWKPRTYLLLFFLAKKNLIKDRTFLLATRVSPKLRYAFGTEPQLHKAFPIHPQAPFGSPTRTQHLGQHSRGSATHGVHPSAGTLPTSSGPHFDMMQKKPSACLKPISKIHCPRDKRCVFTRPIWRDTKRYLWDSLVKENKIPRDATIPADSNGDCAQRSKPRTATLASAALHTNPPTNATSTKGFLSVRGVRGTSEEERKHS